MLIDICYPHALQLLGGLHYIHKQLHLIHRDIKPQNLLVNTQGEVKVLASYAQILLMLTNLDY